MIELTNIAKTYRADEIETRALENVNIKIARGEFISIMGPSGSGKTTLLNLLGLLDCPTSGEMSFDGENVTTCSERQRASLRKANIGFIFQSFNLIDELTVYENVELPLRYLKIKARERKERTMAILERMEIAHRKHHFPSQLSGGQQQRVAIARAVVFKPKLLLADEPTGNLDSVNGDEVMRVLTELNENGTTLVIVTHSPVYASYGNRTIHLYDGHIVTENYGSDRSQAVN